MKRMASMMVWTAGRQSLLPMRLHQAAFVRLGGQAQLLAGSLGQLSSDTPVGRSLDLGEVDEVLALLAQFSHRFSTVSGMLSPLCNNLIIDESEPRCGKECSAPGVMEH